MTVQVHCRRGGEARMFLLGARWLLVMRVEARRAGRVLRRALVHPARRLIAVNPRHGHAASMAFA